MEKALPLKKSEILAKLFKDYGLFFDPTNKESKDNDVFHHPHYKIITRNGIDKIQKAAGILVRFEPVYADATTVILKATCTRGEEVIETFASASDKTSKNHYYAEMAEKRARSRGVLMLAGLYEYGVYGVDEADEFSTFVRNSKGESNLAKYKGDGG